jgi:hypothetical protein
MRIKVAIDGQEPYVHGPHMKYFFMSVVIAFSVALLLAISIAFLIELSFQ